MINIIEGFLAKVCVEWENEALKAQSVLGVRTVCLRFSPILTSKGGLLAKLKPIFQLGLGGVIGFFYYLFIFYLYLQIMIYYYYYY
jgi:NAD dependent epimerase/dehydratase family enzyme